MFERLREYNILLDFRRMRNTVRRLNAAGKKMARYEKRMSDIDSSVKMLALDLQVIKTQIGAQHDQEQEEILSSFENHHLRSRE